MALTEFTPLEWQGDSLRILDQRKLPAEEVWIETWDYRAVVSAIQGMAVRGAPAIGIAGAYGLALAAMELAQTANGDFTDRLHESAREIRNARPTGANLGSATDRMLACLRSAQTMEEVVTDLAREAVHIHQEDIKNNREIGGHGAKLIPWGSRTLTHCNTGALATGGYGTALGIIRTAWRDGRLERVYATETRPLLQGARLTAWELVRDGINACLLADSAAGTLMRRGMVHSVFVGADRIASNGDVANKIGTYNLAVLAKESGVPFYVSAPHEHARHENLIGGRDRDRGARRGRGAGVRRLAFGAGGDTGVQPRVRRYAKQVRDRNCHRARSGASSVPARPGDHAGGARCLSRFLDS